MKEVQNILFDLDGTLTDPKTGIVNSILHALEKLNISESRIYELDDFIGPPLQASFMNRYHMSADEANIAIDHYREYFSSCGLYENQLYPHVKEVLASLLERGYKLYLATSKPTVYARQILDHFGLMTYFTGVVGSNMDNTRTDKTEIIDHVISEYNLDARECVMIGDREHDLIGAANNGLRCIGVLYGYGSHEELSRHQPDYLVSHFRELESIFHRDVFR